MLNFMYNYKELISLCINQILIMLAWLFFVLELNDIFIFMNVYYALLMTMVIHHVKSIIIRIVMKLNHLYEMRLILCGSLC